MRRKTRDTGRLKLIAFFIFVAVLLPKFLNARSTDNLGSFEAGETGIKLCAGINNGNEDALRFLVSNDQGFTSDVIVAKDTCKTIEASAATFTIREYLPQEYVLDSVSGGTVSADATSFLATSAGQYTIIYENTFSGKPYLHNFGYTGSLATATTVGIIFDANGGTGSMDEQFFGLQAQQNLTANTFTREGYNFTGWNTKADGTGTAYEDGHAFTFSEGGEYTLYAQWEEVPSSPSIADDIAEQANDPIEIDFTRKAVASATPTVANGNGINKYTENGQDIYYYRGEIANNNVIWAGKCWKILRTTSTGGVKLIYNGERKQVENFDGDFEPVNECNESGQETFSSNLISKPFNSVYESPAGVGYMYGITKDVLWVSNNNGVNLAYIKVSKSVTKDGNTYYLNGSDGQAEVGVSSANVAAGYRYFCLNGSSVCDEAGISYVIEGYTGSPEYASAYYINIGGYSSIEETIAAMNANTNDSDAKSAIETWFEAEGLTARENDLEDAIFCNDRTYEIGSDRISYASFSRNTVLNDQNNYSPSLDCANKADSFTKEESATGNGMLNHKVGMITADELTLAGININDMANENFLYTGNPSWAMTPFYSQYYPFLSMWTSKMNDAKHNASYQHSLRPVVSLKSSMKFTDGGTGTPTNPYIVEE